MVEPIMYLAIGFLVSMLFGLMIVPLVHNRAVRLTTRRIEAATPLSMAEIQADKDQLRAEFAMSARRLEMSVDQLKNKTTSQLAELGKKSDAINRMKLELGEKNATIFSLEAREKAVKEQMRATEEEFAAKTEALRDAEAALKDKQSELAKINAELSDRSMMAESRQVELVAVRAQIEELRNRVGDAEKEFATTQTRLEQQRRRIREGDARTRRSARAGRKPQPARHRSRPPADRPGQGSRNARQPRQRPGNPACHPGQAARRARLREQPVAAVARTPPSAPRRICCAEIAALNGGKSPAIEKLRNEKAAAEEALRVARDERAKLQRDINAIQQQAESSWATERMENALLARAHQRYRRRSRQAGDAAGRPGLADRGHAGRRAGDAGRESPAPPTAQSSMAACPRAAARWPTASARCSPMPPGRGNRGRRAFASSGSPARFDRD